LALAAVSLSLALTSRIMALALRIEEEEGGEKEEEEEEEDDDDDDELITYLQQQLNRYKQNNTMQYNQ